jgi:predicted dinucleotide-binding enzyme
MKFGILGTGVVGRAIAAKLHSLGNEVMLGTRSVAATMARSEAGRYGNPPVKVWLEQNPGVQLGDFAEAARHGEVVFNATAGQAALEAMQLAGEENLNDKILIDISNPLDFSQGMPPTLTVSNTDSVGEQLQRAYPQVKVVKSLNTMTAALMVEPGSVGDGDHLVFVCGNDAGAKAQVTTLLKDSFGWKEVTDLGDISASRGVEMYLPLWIRLMGVIGTPMFNFKLVR